jgi:4'-phosphopantetheinyl transferase
VRCGISRILEWNLTSRGSERIADDTHVVQSEYEMTDHDLTMPLVQIALARRGARVDAVVWNAHVSQLPEAERQRLARFRRWEDAQSSLLAHILARELVATALNRPADGVELTRDGAGRPYVVGMEDAGVDVNVAHSGDYVAAAVSMQGRVGLDVEVEREVEASLVERCLALEERKLLASMPSRMRRSTFFRLWTLKEAYLKALGVGLGIEPSTVAFSLDRVDPYLRREGDRVAGAMRWRFRSYSPEPGVWLAVCARHALPKACQLREAAPS